MPKKTNRTMLADCFRILRSRNLVAKQNFMCCGTCAGAALHPVVAADATKVGAAYYHKQAGDRLREGGESVMINFGSREGTPEADARIGAVVAATAVKAGLESRWDGNPDRCVEILLPGGIDAEVTVQ